MIAEQPLTRTTSPGRGAIRAEIQAGADDADARRGDEQLVAGAAAHDLGVAGDDRDARLRRRLGHRARDFAQEGDIDALLDDDGAGEIERRRAADGEIVDGAADSQLADVAAGKISGSTTKESVVKASRSPWRREAASRQRA